MEAEPPISYRVLRRELVSILRRKCPGWLRGSVDDLAQEAVLRVWEIQQRSEQDRTFSSFYLRKVAYSVLVDEIRRTVRRKEEPLDVEGEPPTGASTALGPDQHLASREMGRAIVDCMGSMNRNRCRALTLRRLGHNAQEVADLLGWGLKQARNRIYRGLADLRLCLSKKDFTF